MSNKNFSADFNVDTKERLMTAPEIADIFRVSVGTVYRWAREEAVPCYADRDMVRFDLSEVKAAFKKGGNGNG